MDYNLETRQIAEFDESRSVDRLLVFYRKHSEPMRYLILQKDTSGGNVLPLGDVNVLFELNKLSKVEFSKYTNRSALLTKTFGQFEDKKLLMMCLVDFKRKFKIKANDSDDNDCVLLVEFVRNLYAICEDTFVIVPIRGNLWGLGIIASISPEVASKILSAILIVSSNLRHLEIKFLSVALFRKTVAMILNKFRLPKMLPRRIIDLQALIKTLLKDIDRGIKFQQKPGFAPLEMKELSIDPVEKIKFFGENEEREGIEIASFLRLGISNGLLKINDLLYNLQVLIPKEALKVFKCELSEVYPVGCSPLASKNRSLKHAMYILS
ncbi:MAG: hypothetical protein QXY55_00505 [Candidatus Korarchaeota archaeon]|nr:hypothetical protein [Thermoproteota archaeon]MCR8501041.1 hypothetical protein [Thermoproteota archaeon]